MTRTKDAKFKDAAADPIDHVSVTNVHFAFDGPTGPDSICNVSLAYISKSGAYVRSSPVIQFKGEAFNKVVDAIRKAGAVHEGETHEGKIKQAVLEVAAEEGLLPEDVTP